MNKRNGRNTGLRSVAVAASVALGLAASSAFAEKKYDEGASDTEIKIGNTLPYSGPASAYGIIGKVEGAYFKMINDQGGINGRKINFISLDDGYNPAKTVEQVRKLVEEEKVLFVFQTLGTAHNTAIHKYMNDRKIPQLFVATGATKWGDYKNYPWTMGWQPNYQAEARAYAAYVLKHMPNAKVGILYQNDDFGKDYLHGFKEGFGDKASKMIVKEVSYEVSDPTVDSQIIALKSSGADVFFNVATPKFAAPAIRKAYDIGWKPTQFISNVSANVGSVLAPAGLEKSKGVITAQYLKDPTDPQWQKGKEYEEFMAFKNKYLPDTDIKDINNVYGYSVASTLVRVLKACGDNLTRENVMKQAANLKNVQEPMVTPKVMVNTSPTDYFPLEAVLLGKFNGEKFVSFGEVLGR
ncbi:MAG: ABC transporter substrate-binding protein [Sulfurifustaceae bacterium]